MYLQRIYSVLLALLLISGFLLPAQSKANGFKAAIIYPDIKPPYDAIFTSIIDGITSYPDINTIIYKLGETSQARGLRKWIEYHKPDILIILGQQSYTKITGLNLAIPTIVSAILQPIPNQNCICLNINPDSLFELLLKLKPEIKRVFVVYSEKNNGWLLPSAIKSAKHLDIELVASQAGTPQQAARHYKTILSNQIGPTDAIWLPIDNVLPKNVILPEILKSAWHNKFVVFSSNPYYVKRGGLFALFPDHNRLGEQIARASVKILSTKKHNITANSRYTKSAINIRTAHHLGINLEPRFLKTFEIIYPQR